MNHITDEERAELDRLTMSLIEQYGWQRQVIIGELLSKGLSLPRARASYGRCVLRANRPER